MPAISPTAGQRYVKNKMRLIFRGLAIQIQGPDMFTIGTTQ